MRVLVTGASGFIGGHVLRLLTSTENEVVGFDIADPGPVAASVHDEIQFIRGDVTDPVDVYNAITAVNPECVVHLASLLVPDSRANPRKAFDVNVGGTVNVLEAARSNDVSRVVAGSSVNVYGNGAENGERISEATVRQPNTTYAMTKYALEWLGSTFDVEFAAIEPVHGFGPDRVRGNSYDAAVVKAAVSGIPLEVPQTGIQDEFLYVEDSARAFVTAAITETLSHDRYLVGTDQHATLAEIVEFVSEVVPEAEIHLQEKPADATWEGDRNNHPPTDSSRIQDDLGWKPTYSLQEMVEAYVEWLITNPESWEFSREDIPWKQ
ncbi:NAD-dependent epimerase/dehydratase family protein [Natrinema gelatinilyticum]|uniref:NAD-dependent epimerase/dehydratase family protein n=1 Tax=Natrinema gelatinilyticum TaxID=2961571 RepID=UPI0020C2BC04|nr:NAD-dependent epimerase/dehydratase family protein [Natrinema gelatinilyticum]